MNRNSNLMQLARLYLRASTIEQDATRARRAVEAFAAEQNLRIASVYIENESGAKLRRPELVRLLDDAQPGDILLLESVDRLSRLGEAEWKLLRSEIDAKQMRVVALDLPTSWTMVMEDDFTGRIFGAVNAMMLDVLAAIARKDYNDRRRRQAEGIVKARAANKYRGRPEDTARNAGIARMLRSKTSWSEIQSTTKCSRATISKIARRIKENTPG